ncbi:hypothetical protein EJ04DRAFT_549554 [Polyplosphaeria fusca]|uniref:Uncharacterized protein n=1 Tax=Polyplosphaeria fusca TaxID=682080 RepID=A0A9P4R988_9PLEO|nr:hypothetical protein EJ04DRAFT_549554 [Polyplosphaeria fusca]
MSSSPQGTHHPIPAKPIMSLWKKILHLGGKKNPYTDPAHPNNTPTPSSTTPCPPTFPRRSSAPRPASPRTSPDFLAEAREAVGRDRITGRHLVPRAPEQAARRGRSVPGERARSGTKYDVFVQEMQERRVGNAREPVGGWYAPAPRVVGEFYAPGGGG